MRKGVRQSPTALRQSPKALRQSPKAFKTVAFGFTLDLIMINHL